MRHRSLAIDGRPLTAENSHNSKAYDGRSSAVGGQVGQASSLGICLIYFALALKI